MLPCQRKTRSQSKMRRSHNALRPVHTVRCPNCNSPKLPHAACAKCGYVRHGLKLKVAEEA